ncbi:hypothetical protein BU200_10255, partial [Streptococcus acidominimus]
MSFQYTDKQLNILNQGENVYSVNENYAKRKDFDILTNSESPHVGESNTIEIDKQEFRVIKVYSDPETGFDGMAVAPIVNGEPDFSSVAVIAAATDIQSVDTMTAVFGDSDGKKSQGYYLSRQ